MEDAENVRDDKWYGVPAKGQRAVPGKGRYILEILGVIVLEFVLWGIYRVVSAPYIRPFGSLKFYLVHIIAAPTIHLIPIVLYWRYVRKEKGHPFTFTRKRLLSGLMVGMLSAVLWRVLEMLVSDTLSGIAGGTVLGTLDLYSFLDSTTLLLFGIMTFTHFFVVGPVEELQFRGFTQDQAARVLPNWQALIFASVLFGLSHVPIAITVYRMPFLTLIVAEIGWMTAGAVFGALYMWSRNIWACIVMHGMGNWQLSVFMLRSRATADGLGTAGNMTVGVLTQLLVNGAMIGIFYLISKYYWEPQRRGEAVFEGAFSKLRRKIFEHDRGKRSLANTSAKGAVFSVLTCLLILGATFAVGETDFSGLAPIPDGGGHEEIDLSSLVPVSEVKEGDGELDEGSSMVISFNSMEGKYLKKISVEVVWEDEDDIQRLRLYENQPDTFSVKIEVGNTTDGNSASNPREAQGEVSASVELTREDVGNITGPEGGNYTATVTVTMEKAGNYEARVGMGSLQLVDTGNKYQYKIELTWLERAEG